MAKSSLSKTKKVSPLPAGQFVLGRDRFEQISAVEGIYLTADMRSTLESFKRDGLSAEDCRIAIMKRFTPTR